MTGGSRCAVEELPNRHGGLILFYGDSFDSKGFPYSNGTTTRVITPVIHLLIKMATRLLQTIHHELKPQDLPAWCIREFRPATPLPRNISSRLFLVDRCGEGLRSGWVGHRTPAEW